MCVFHPLTSCFFFLSLICGSPHFWTIFSFQLHDLFSFFTHARLHYMFYATLCMEWIRFVPLVFCPTNLEIFIEGEMFWKSSLLFTWYIYETFDSDLSSILNLVHLMFIFFKNSLLLIDGEFKEEYLWRYFDILIWMDIMNKPLVYQTNLIEFLSFGTRFFRDCYVSKSIWF